MRAVGVIHKVEGQTERHQLVDQQLGSLEMNVVVAGAVDDQEVAFEILREAKSCASLFRDDFYSVGDSILSGRPMPTTTNPLTLREF